MITVRSATTSDFESIDGSPPGRTVRALVLEQDGRRLALFGVYPMNTNYVMFSTFTDECRANKRAMAMAVKSIWQLIAKIPAMPLLAHADPEIKGSDVLLRHMGFEQYREGFYQCPGHKQSRRFSQ